MTTRELADALASREAAIGELGLDDRLDIALHDVEGDREELIGIMLLTSVSLARGDIDRALKITLMGGIELGRELERRV